MMLSLVKQTRLGRACQGWNSSSLTADRLSFDFTPHSPSSYIPLSFLSHFLCHHRLLQPIVSFQDHISKGEREMGRAPCCDKANVKKGPWSPEEDTKLKDYIDKCGTGGNWIALPHKAGLKRCGKSCRLRWLNYLRPNIKHGDFSDDEDRIICSLYASIGSRWSIIAAQLPGRTDNDIKNYWNTKLKKKLLGIPPSQRKPNPQHQQQPQQQFIFQSTLQNSTALPSSIQDSCIYNPSRPLFSTGVAEGFSLMSSDLINTLPQGYHSLVQQHDQYQMKGNSGLLVFNGDQQSCSSSDGSCNQNSKLGFEGPLFLAGGDAAAPLEYSYEEMKHLVNPSSVINYLDHDPSTARGDMSLKSHGGRVTYYY